MTVQENKAEFLAAVTRGHVVETNIALEDLRSSPPGTLK
jgi:hypothetical protein